MFSSRVLPSPRDSTCHNPVTPGLTRTIDAIAKGFDGFHFGRFDVRYTHPDDLENGDFKIIELNGITSESTNIYDPDRSLAAAYRTLYAQWRTLFEIGAANRKRGVAIASWREIIRALRSHFLGGRVRLLAG